MRGTVRRCLRIRQAASEGEGETCAWWRRTVMVMLASFFFCRFHGGCGREGDGEDER